MHSHTSYTHTPPTLTSQTAREEAEDRASAVAPLLYQLDEVTRAKEDAEDRAAAVPMLLKQLDDETVLRELQVGEAEDRASAVPMLLQQLEVLEQQMQRQVEQQQ
jgi:hypothetical protein